MASLLPTQEPLTSPSAQTRTRRRRPPALQPQTAPAAPASAAPPSPPAGETKSSAPPRTPPRNSTINFLSSRFAPPSPFHNSTSYSVDRPVRVELGADNRKTPCKMFKKKRGLDYKSKEASHTNIYDDGLYNLYDMKYRCPGCGNKQLCFQDRMASPSSYYDFRIFAGNWEQMAWSDHNADNAPYHHFIKKGEGRKSTNNCIFDIKGMHSKGLWSGSPGFNRYLDKIIGILKEIINNTYDIQEYINAIKFLYDIKLNFYRSEAFIEEDGKFRPPREDGSDDILMDRFETELLAILTATNHASYQWYQMLESDPLNTVRKKGKLSSEIACPAFTLYRFVENQNEGETKETSHWHSDPNVEILEHLGRQYSFNIITGESMWLDDENRPSNPFAERIPEIGKDWGEVEGNGNMSNLSIPVEMSLRQNIPNGETVTPDHQPKAYNFESVLTEDAKWPLWRAVPQTVSTTGVIGNAGDGQFTSPLPRSPDTAVHADTVIHHQPHVRTDTSTFPSSPSDKEIPEADATLVGEAAPFESVEAALAAGISQREIDAWFASYSGESKEEGEKKESKGEEVDFVAGETREFGGRKKTKKRKRKTKRGKKRKTKRGKKKRRGKTKRRRKRGKKKTKHKKKRTRRRR